MSQSVARACKLSELMSLIAPAEDQPVSTRRHGPSEHLKQSAAHTQAGQWTSCYADHAVALLHKHYYKMLPSHCKEVWLADPTFVPCVLVTKVLPIPRCEKVLGAFTSYQSFLAKGSTLHTGTTSVRQR